jgi:hypothetical protein
MARKPALDEDQQKELKCIVEQEIGLHRSFKNNHEEWNETKSPAPKIHTTKELGKLYNTSERTTGGYITKLFENDKDLLKERTHYVRCQTKSGENHPMYGKTHSEETKRKMSGENHPMYGKTGENNPMYGKTHSEETKRKMSKAKSGENNYWYGKTGENHPMYGKTHSEETKRKMSEKMSGENHPMYGKPRSDETKIKLSKINSGENHPMYGKTHSEETKIKMSETHTGKTHSKETKRKMSGAKSGENNPMYGKTGENNPMYGKTHSEESKIKMSGAKSGENNYWYGKTHSEETKIKMSGENHYWYGKTGENHPMYGKTGENHPMYGKTHSEESKIKMSGAKIGENHPNWNGGTSFLPYGPSFEKVMKPLIRARDDYNCQFCDIQENGKAHAVHHIDHDKNNDLEQNLILLCQPCHNTETSSNKNTEIKREEWIKWSQSKINDIYQSMTKEKKNELQQVKNDLENKLGLQK